MATDKQILVDALKRYHDCSFTPGVYEHSIVGQAAMMLEKSEEVVRCKDCVSYDERCLGFGYCYHWDYEPGMSPNQVDGDDFCSYGERKDND